MLIGSYKQYRSSSLTYVFIQYPKIKDLREYKQYKKSQELQKNISKNKTVGMKRLRITKEELESTKEVISIHNDTKRRSWYSKYK